MRDSKSALVALALTLAACSGSSISVTDGTAACASAVACGLVGQTNIQACTANVLAINDPNLVSFFQTAITATQVDCLARAGHDCNAAKMCLNNGQAPSSCSGTGPQSCTGTVMTSCESSGGQNFTTQFDCAVYGEMCLSGKNHVECGAGTCAAVAATCSGTSVQTCDNNNVFRLFDCTEIGASCNPSLVAHCRGNGAACAAPSASDSSLRCDGDTLVSCLDGQEAALDCTKLGVHCFANAKGDHAACALGNACDPSTYGATCSGTTLSFCNDGRVDTYDCAQGGFTMCNPANGGSCQ
jgi:hypothetical protein